MSIADLCAEIGELRARQRGEPVRLCGATILGFLLGASCACIAFAYWAAP